MKNKSTASFLRLLTLACTIFLPLSLQSEATETSGTIDQIKLGTHLYGASIDKKALAGKVVVMEFWGMACAPCKKGFPHLVELARQYKDKPFHLIASNWQGGFDNAVILAFLKECKMEENEPNMTVVDQGGHPGMKVNGLPFWGVFNHKGELVKAVRGAVEDELIATLVEKAQKIQPEGENSKTPKDS